MRLLHFLRGKSGKGDGSGEICNDEKRGFGGDGVKASGNESEERRLRKKSEW